MHQFQVGEFVNVTTSIKDIYGDYGSFVATIAAITFEGYLVLKIGIWEAVVKHSQIEVRQVSPDQATYTLINVMEE